MHWITQNEFDSDLQGFIPEMKDWVGTRCDSQINEQKSSSANRNAKALSFEDTKASLPENRQNRVGCWMRVKAQLSNEAWKNLFLRK